MLTCELPDCPFSRNGKCLEGRGAECPNLVKVGSDPLPNEPVTVIDNSGEISTSSEVFHLPGVEPLDVHQARALARQRPVSLVVIAGMLGAGKTSLIARFHQLFQAGPIGSINFAGSLTLPKFEEINWRSTVESGEETPNIERTSSKYDNSFLHFSVYCSEEGKKNDLLINDVSGETFNAAISSQYVCDQLIGLQRADHLAIAIDGAALADQKLRFHQISQIKDFVRRIISGGKCGKKTSIHFVVTKFDKLDGQSVFLEELEKDLLEFCSSSFGGAEYCLVAARPENEAMPTVDTISELFSKWCKGSVRYSVVSSPNLPRASYSRDICRFSA